MAYSNQTPNYGLPLPVGTDKSSWLDTNTSFQAVDTALKGAVDGVAALSGTTGGISEALTGLTNRVDGIDTDITRLKNADGTIVGNFGTVETGQVSAHEYSAGDMFVWLNVIRKATVAIHVGDQFVNGTNCVIVSLDEVIGNLSELLSLGDNIVDVLKSRAWIKVYEISSDGVKTFEQIFNQIRNSASAYFDGSYDLRLISKREGSINIKNMHLITGDEYYFIDTTIFPSEVQSDQIKLASTGSTYLSAKTNYSTNQTTLENISNAIATVGRDFILMATKL